MESVKLHAPSPPVVTDLLALLAIVPLQTFSCRKAELGECKRIRMVMSVNRLPGWLNSPSGGILHNTV